MGRMARRRRVGTPPSREIAAGGTALGSLRRGNIQAIHMEERGPPREAVSPSVSIATFEGGGVANSNFCRVWAPFSSDDRVKRTTRRSCMKFVLPTASPLLLPELRRPLLFPLQRGGTLRAGLEVF
jgi:hypothetical protein